MTAYGVHTGLQHTTVHELRDLWGRIEDLGYDWISIWDHFYAANLGDGATCLEAVAAHAALACATSRVRCGSLVYSVGYRHPAVLAKAITTIDHLSGGRADMGLGAGWSQVEYEAYGIPFPPIGTRMDQLEEAVQCVRGLLRREATDFAGEWYTLTEARNEPRPVQDAVPIWIGGGGERRTLRIAARFADGWNIPFVAPDAFAAKRDVLHRHCDEVGRNPDEIRCAVNVGIAWDEAGLLEQFGGLADHVRPGVLTGSDDEVLTRLGAYVETGADQVNIALRASTGDGPTWDVDALERLAVALRLAA